jgi:hypothetical protein
MKGFITKAVAAVCGASLLGVAGGCYHYRDLVDPCYPERYNYMARQEVHAALTPQVHNGHVLDQTIWNYHFEYDATKQMGTDKLTPGGMDDLAELARRRPVPDPMLYLQTAHDIPYDPAAPEKFAQLRADLDSRRIQAIQKYLGAETAGRNLSFQVAVHDPAEPGMAAYPAGLSILRMHSAAQGGLPSSAGAGASNVSGGAGAVSGGR